MIFTSAIWRYLIFGGAAVLLVAGFVWYASYLNGRIEKYKTDIDTLTNAIKTQQEVIRRSIEDRKQIVKTIKELDRTTRNLDRNVKDLENKFRKNGRDFGRLVKEKPALVEKRINKGTKDALRCMEIITGDTKNEKDIERCRGVSSNGSSN